MQFRTKDTHCTLLQDPGVQTCDSIQRVNVTSVLSSDSVNQDTRKKLVYTQVRVCLFNLLHLGFSRVASIANHISTQGTTFQGEFIEHVRTMSCTDECRAQAQNMLGSASVSAAAAAVVAAAASHPYTHAFSYMCVPTYLSTLLVHTRTVGYNVLFGNPHIVRLDCKV